MPYPTSSRAGRSQRPITRRRLLALGATGSLCVLAQPADADWWRIPRTFPGGRPGIGQPGAVAPAPNSSPAGAANRSPFVPPGYAAVWSDEFDRLALAPASGTGNVWLPMWGRWNVRHLAGNNDRALKYADAERLADGRLVGEVLRVDGRWGAGPAFLHEVGNGILKLRAFPLRAGDQAGFRGFPFVASMLSGERLFAQRYGYWETRLRVARLGRGHHLAVWLLPTDASWPPEIDIVEVVGQEPAKFHAAAHGAGGGLRWYDAPNGANGWHVFGFGWTSTVMRWTCEGRLVREQPNFVNDKEFYFLISWEIGSKWPGPTDASTPWPGEIEVDYVRIYRRG